MKKRSWKIRFLGNGILAAVIVVVGLFTLLKPIFIIRPPQDIRITVTATGQEGEQAKGTAVRIRSIRADQRNSVDLNTLSGTAGWKMDGDLLVAYGATKPVGITTTCHNASSVEVQLLSSQDSGRVEVNINGQVFRKDLSAGSAGSMQLIHYDVPGKFDPLTRWDLVIEFWGVVLLLIYGGIYWHANREE